jgi:hypothetical protein
MNISSFSSAINTLSAAHNRAAIAGQSIASQSLPSRAFEQNSDLTTPLINLKEAELQNAAGVKLLQAEKTMLGAILDITA